MNSIEQALHELERNGWHEEAEMAERIWSEGKVYLPGHMDRFCQAYVVAANWSIRMKHIPCSHLNVERRECMASKVFPRDCSTCLIYTPRMNKGEKDADQLWAPIARAFTARLDAVGV